MKELYLSILNRLAFSKHLKIIQLMSGKKPIIWVLALIICIIGLYFLSGLIYSKIYDNQILSSLSQTRPISSKQALTDTNLSRINSLIELPPDELATVGKIQDIKSLKSKNSIFKNAQNGDIVLIYPDLTIVYDPVNKYVVSITPNSILK